MRIISQNDLSQSGNIAQFSLELPEEGDRPLSVKVTPRACAAEATTFSARPGDRLTVGIHVHALPSGPQHVSFELERDGKTLCSLDREITVPQWKPLAAEVREMMRAGGTPTIFAGPCDSSYYPYTDSDFACWFDRPDAHDHIQARLERNEIDANEARLLGEFVDNGFLIIEGAIDDELVDAVNAEIDEAVADGYGGYTKGSSQRIEHLHFKYPNIRKLWLDERHRRMADLIFEDRGLPCQTLVFVCGSEQSAHQDTIHLTPFPAGLMCGTWIALQDVQPDSGELVVYPGSHREPRVYLREAGCEKVSGDQWERFGQTVVPKWHEMSKKYEPVVYRPKKGTVLIWHENLLHEGSRRADTSLERRSIVIHSFAESAVVYYDSTGLVGSVERSVAT